MPRRNGRGPDGNGPKRDNQGTPTPRRDGRGRGNGRGRSTGRGGRNR